MKLSVKELLNTSSIIKAGSVFCGYMLWLMWSQANMVEVDVELPICFYNLNVPIQTNHEKVLVTLKGKRSDFYSLDISSLAVHINAQALSAGTTRMHLDENMLFLPHDIKLLAYSPCPLNIEYQAQGARALT